MLSDQGNPQGMFFYADMLEHGKGGLPKQMTMAVMLYALAASKGHAGAIGHLGYLAFQGEGVVRDIEGGIQMMQMAAEMGDIQSLMRMAEILEAAGNGPAALKYYLIVGASGYPAGLFHLSRCFELGIGCSPDPAKAAELYQLLIDQHNSADAMFRLGQLKVSGKGVQKDVEGGKRLLQRAAALGNNEAAQALMRLAK
jgi:TPR repeat protein